MLEIRLLRALLLLTLLPLSLTACGAATPATAPPPAPTTVPTVAADPTAATVPTATAPLAAAEPSATVAPPPPTTAATVAAAPAPPVPPADEATSRITVPPGFHITVFADGLPGARFMDFGLDGALYVSLMGTGRIARLPDVDGDGSADAVQIAAEGLSTRTGWNGATGGSTWPNWIVWSACATRTATAC